MIPDICSICNSPRSDSAGPCVACGAAPEAPARNLPAGTHLQNGRYTLGRVLGEGGFGITYQGAHRYLKRTVAIKELFPEWAMRHGTTVSAPDSRQREFHMEKERVLEEARIISRLNSLHIVEVQDAFLENNTAYIVMEYLEGQSLQERIDAEGPLPPYDVHRIAIAACNALAEVHTQDLLHRDIKPANIMLASDGSIVLVDFGSARTFDHGQTVSHTRILTTDYAAPEMYSTQARFGPYTDLFCLGGTLFHALTGRPPPASMDRLLDHRVDIEFPQDLQGPMSAVIHQALQIAVEDRPQSAADFKAVCVEVAVPRPAAWEPEPPSDVEVWNPATTFLSHILHGHTGRIRDLAFSFDGLILASAGEDKTICLWDVATGSLWQTLKAPGDKVLAVAFSLDGQTLASAGEDKTIRLWDVETGALMHTIIGHEDTIYSLSFSLDGLTLAGSEDKTICLWDVETGTLMHTIIGRENEVLRVGSVYNSRIFVDIDVISKGNIVRLWSAEGVPTGTSFGKLATSEILANQVSVSHNWHGDGFSFAFHYGSQTQARSLCWDSVVHLTDLATFDHRHFLTRHNGVYSLSFSFDGTLLACGGGEGDINLWNGAGGI